MTRCCRSVPATGRVMAARFTSEVSSVCLLDVDPGFADGISEQDLPQARRALTVPTAAVPSGRFDFAGVAARHGDNALLLVLSGAIGRDVQVLDRMTSQLFGPGDVLATCGRAADSLNARVSFHAERPARVALLQGRFHAAARVWPSLSGLVQHRLG